MQKIDIIISQLSWGQSDLPVQTKYYTSYKITAVFLAEPRKQQNLPQAGGTLES